MDDDLGDEGERSDGWAAIKIEGAVMYFSKIIRNYSQFFSKLLIQWVDSVRVHEGYDGYRKGITTFPIRVHLFEINQIGSQCRIASMHWQTSEAAARKWHFARASDYPRECGKLHP